MDLQTPHNSPPGLSLDLRDHNVLITGAAGNLGAGIARRFAAAGANIALHGRSASTPLQNLAAELSATGATAEIVVADLNQPGAAEALVRGAVAAIGPLTTLVNNAGVQPVTPLSEMSTADWQAVHHTNLTAVFALSSAAAANMAANGVTSGSIIHIASIEASRPAAGHAHYAAAKAGLVMHARAAALELGPQGIRVNTVSPGLIDRPGIAADWPEGVNSWIAHAPLGRLASPTDIGNTCVFLASPLASFITGQDIAVDGGMLTTPGW